MFNEDDQARTWSQHFHLQLPNPWSYSNLTFKELVLYGFPLVVLHTIQSFPSTCDECLEVFLNLKEVNMLRSRLQCSNPWQNLRRNIELNLPCNILLAWITHVS